MMVMLPPKHLAQVIFFQRVISTVTMLLLRNFFISTDLTHTVCSSSCFIF